MSEFLENLAAELTDSSGETVSDDGGASHSADEALASDVQAYESYRKDRDTLLGVDGEVSKPEPQRQPDRIPLATLHAERQAHQQLKMELEISRRGTAEMQAALAQMEAQLAGAQQVPQMSFDEDPKAYIEQRERQFADDVQQLRAQVAQQQQRAEIDNVVRSANAQEESFRTEVGRDIYDQAMQFVEADVDKRLQAQHPESTAEQRQQIKTAAVLQHVIASARLGVNPAQHIYQQAVANGFKPKAAAARDVAANVAQMSDADFDAWWKREMVDANRVGPSF